MGDTASSVEGRVLPPEYVPGRNGGMLKPFQKGVSGNPTGFGGEYAEARRICLQHTTEAVEKQLALMSSPDERVAFMATEAILNRGIGKPRDHSGDTAVNVDLSALSASQRRTLAELLRVALGKQEEG